MPSTSGNEWKLIKVLGSGSFGEVLLYQYGETSDLIALKKCKNLLQNENLKRWQDEVEFMRNLNHPNIVKGCPVPPVLEAKPTEPPCLAMEYCSRGDLRKKLSELPNVCGLTEAEILLLAKHIASAMEYLHKADIIHRDIKPENIMVQDHMGQNVFKLTDLGFAKDSKNQPATSFVGTKEYMAPELYSETQYTKTADYWSFGTVLSEIITGNRPFMLSVLPVVRWHEIIAKKNIRDIGYYEDCFGMMNYAKNLPEPHQLCTPMRESLEKLLNLLLRRDPGARGGHVRDGRPMFYQWIEVILDCKVINVRCMTDGRLLSFPTRNNDAVNDLHKTLTSVTGLPADQHVLLLENGNRLADGQVTLHDIFRNHSREWIVYLYQKDIPVRDNNFYIPQQTPMAAALMENNHLQVSENGFKVMWKQSIHYCHHLMRDASARKMGFIAYLNYNLKLKDIYIQRVAEMKKSLHKLQAQAEFFLESMNTDTQHYARQVATGFSSARVYDKWKETTEKVQAITEMPEKEVEKIEKRLEQTKAFIYETQKNAERLKTVDGLQETSKKCDASFRKFKEENKAMKMHRLTAEEMVKRRENMDLKPIQTQMLQAHKQFLEYNQAIFAQIKEVQKSCKMIDGAMAIIQECILKMDEAQKCISQFQRDKQKTMWEVLEVTIKKKRESDAQVQRQLSRSKSLVGPNTPPSAGSGGAAPVFDPQSDSDWQSNYPIQDSMSILNMSLQLHTEFDQQMKSLTAEQKQNAEEVEQLNWDHLGDT